MDTGKTIFGQLNTINQGVLNIWYDLKFALFTKRASMAKGLGKKPYL